MVELIISILASIGLCLLIHFAIHLIKKIDKNANTPQNEELNYWYITYAVGQRYGSCFISTSTEYLRLKEIRESFKKDISGIENPIIITNFMKVSKEFFDENKENALTLNL